MSKALNPKHWEVTVLLDGEIVLAISHCHLAGISNISDYGDTVQLCAEQLLAFIGKRTSEQEQLQTRAQELEDMAKDYREKVRSWASKALHENAEKCRLEAENAELRAELFCNQMCVRYWPSHHSNCRLLAIRLNRIKQQADDEGEA